MTLRICGLLAISMDGRHRKAYDLNEEKKRSEEEEEEGKKYNTHANCMSRFTCYKFNVFDYMCVCVGRTVERTVIFAGSFALTQ